MRVSPELPFPVLDALLLGAHRLSVLTDEALYRACGVRVMFTGRLGGVSRPPFAQLNLSDVVGDDAAAVAANRALVCEAAGVDASSLVTLNQVHGTRIVYLRSADELDEVRRQADEGADGVLIGEARIPTMVLSADCAVFAIVAPCGAFAVAHAGWRGALEHIARSVLDALAAKSGESPDTFNAYIGPHILADCFEVGEEVEQLFREEFGDRSIASPRHVSLEAALLADLRAGGMDSRRVASAGICTICDSDRYYSYRASNGECGRHAAFACRVN